MKSDFKKFKCLQCGNCCKWSGYVRVSEKEINAIADFFKMDQQLFITEYTRLTADRSGLSLIENNDKSCIFLKEKNNKYYCQINQVKPQQCINFPHFWRFENWENECHGGRELLKIDNNN